MHLLEFLKLEFLTRKLFEKYEWRKMEEKWTHLYLSIYMLLYL